MESAAMIARMRCGMWWRRSRGQSRNESCGGFDGRAPGCESVRAATLGELWNEATNGIASRLPGARNMMDSKGLARWRGLVCVTPEKFSGCAKRPPKGVSPKFFAPGAVASGACWSAGQSSSGIIKVMAGCGSSMSSAPQVAMSLTSRAARLSLRT